MKHHTKSSIFLFSIMAGMLAMVLYHSFVISLPTWCEHPERQGYWLVEPLCK